MVSPSTLGNTSSLLTSSVVVSSFASSVFLVCSVSSFITSLVSSTASTGVV